MRVAGRGCGALGSTVCDGHGTRCTKLWCSQSRVRLAVLLTPDAESPRPQPSVPVQRLAHAAAHSPGVRVRSHGVNVPMPSPMPSSAARRVELEAWPEAGRTGTGPSGARGMGRRSCGGYRPREPSGCSPRQIGECARSAGRSVGSDRVYSRVYFARRFACSARILRQRPRFSMRRVRVYFAETGCALDGSGREDQWIPSPLDARIASTSHPAASDPTPRESACRRRV